MKVDEYPFGKGLSLFELFDASNECRHGRLPHDGPPPCGCWKGWERGELVVVVKRLPEKRSRAA